MADTPTSMDVTTEPPPGESLVCNPSLTAVLVSVRRIAFDEIWASLWWTRIVRDLFTRSGGQKPPGTKEAPWLAPYT